jgi:hypothetical protein
MVRMDGNMNYYRLAGCMLMLASAILVLTIIFYIV